MEVQVGSPGSLRWGLICGDDWGTLEAMVACRQLGLGYANHGLQVRSPGVGGEGGGRAGAGAVQGWHLIDTGPPSRRPGIGTRGTSPMWS